MKRQLLTIVVLICLTFLSTACGPSKVELAATSVAETIAAYTPTPTITPTHTPTITPIPTQTITPTPTFTPTPTDTPTPTPLPEIGDTLVSPVDGMVLMYVPAGEFYMGSRPGDGEDDEHPRHMIRLDALWMDQSEVTNAMYALFVADTGYQTNAERVGSAIVYLNETWNWVIGANWLHPRGSDSNIDGLENHPVVQVNWDDAVAYCTWAGRRLPTEAEWEYAARGTDGRTYPWGNQNPSGTLVNFADMNIDLGWSDTNVNDGYEFTAPVGSFPAGTSLFGMLDMAGNVSEWVADWYDGGYYADSPQENPAGPNLGDGRVIRGGSFTYFDYQLRTAYRMWVPQSTQYWDLGFRCVQTP